MRVTALKDLSYSPDGIRIEGVQAGQEFDCPEGIVADYLADGLICAPGSDEGRKKPEDTPKNGAEQVPDQADAIALKEAAANASIEADRKAALAEAGDEAAAKAAEADASPRHPKAAPRKKA